MRRKQIEQIIKDLGKKMVFLVGPRQVGKTWLAKEISKAFKKPVYLNYDRSEDRQIIRDESWPKNTDLLILDELHKMKGWKNYLKTYIQPSPILAPFHIIGEITRTFSLALRLFGNILGEEIIIAILFILSPLIVPVPMMLFAIFTGVIQAYIFSILTIVYLSAAVEKEGSSEG